MIKLKNIAILGAVVLIASALLIALQSQARITNPSVSDTSGFVQKAGDTMTGALTVSSVVSST